MKLLSGILSLALAGCALGIASADASDIGAARGAASAGGGLDGAGLWTGGYIGIQGGGLWGSENVFFPVKNTRTESKV